MWLCFPSIEPKGSLPALFLDPDILEDKTKYVEGWGWDHTKWLLEEWPNYVRSNFRTDTLYDGFL